MRYSTSRTCPLTKFYFYPALDLGSGGVFVGVLLNNSWWVLSGGSVCGLSKRRLVVSALMPQLCYDLFL